MSILVELEPHLLLRGRGGSIAYSYLFSAS